MVKKKVKWLLLKYNIQIRGDEIEIWGEKLVGNLSS